MKRTFIAALTAAMAVLVCSTFANAQLKWPISVKFVYDANGMPPGNDLDCSDSTAGSAISCDAEVLEKIEYANQILRKLGRGYTFEVVEILPWTNPPPLTNLRVCVGGDNDGQMCVPNGPAGCACASDCCFSNGTAGCDNLFCEAIVCDVDPFCCNTGWDQLCADEAADLCGSLCSVCADGVWEPAPSTDLSTISAGPLHILLGCLARADIDSNGDGLSEVYLWRDGALNTYIINENGGGVCGPRRCHSADLSVTVIGQGKAGANIRPFHEYSHCLGLCHTHGCSWGTCCHDPSQTPAKDSGTCSSGDVSLGQDCLSDSLPDHRSCETLPLLVQMNFEAGNLSQPMYDDLPCQERQMVINTLYNIVSYHMDDNDARTCDGTLPLIECNCDEPSPYGCPSSALDQTTRCRHQLTSDQLDLMTDRSNAHAGGQLDTGCTRFVDAAANPKDLMGTPSCGDLSNEPLDGSSVHPYVTVTEGLLAADAGDIVLIRAGSYNEPMIITQRVTLRASRGDAFIGK